MNLYESTLFKPYRPYRYLFFCISHQASAKCTSCASCFQTLRVVDCSWYPDTTDMWRRSRSILGSALESSGIWMAPGRGNNYCRSPHETGPFWVKKKPSDFHQVSTPEDAASTSKVQVGVDIPWNKPMKKVPTTTISPVRAQKNLQITQQWRGKADGIKACLGSCRRKSIRNHLDIDGYNIW